MISIADMRADDERNLNHKTSLAHLETSFLPPNLDVFTKRNKNAYHDYGEKILRSKRTR
jgi:hypothetical protein